MTPRREIERCPVCDQTQRAVVYRASISLVNAAVLKNPYAAHYQINRCLGCGLLLSSPIFDGELVCRLYSEASETNTAEEEIDNVRRTMAGYYALVRSRVPARQRILDIGCDRGLLLQAARADGFEEIFGIEPNPTARSAAERLLDAEISSGYYEESEYPPNYFDAVTLVHVLDHVIDPQLVLRRALRDLRPNGVILAVVHNVESIFVRLFGERFPIFNLYHHYFFSKKTLRQLFGSLGYEPIFIGPTRNCYSLRYLAGRVPGLPLVVTRSFRKVLEGSGIGSAPITVPLGNIAIVARRPA